ncbi:Berberine/berberine-like protein [Artemisia annua]|uniref:Berberine/berberine-like protein n=1 Tax=Artemisia annua TaxID=35608 RepID=A0A2U1QJS1_ARTAN|nr:Berberine/berberine-like protein [Artemisia annua]
MNLMFLRRAFVFKEIVSYRFQSRKHGHGLSILRAVHNGSKSVYRAPLFSNIGGDESNDYKIEIVDDETWKVATGFAGVLKKDIGSSLVTNASRDHVVNRESGKMDDADVDDIDDLRICGKLFYKLDKDSKEYEEYNYDFHRRKSSKSKKNETRNENASKSKDETKENKMKVTPRNNSVMVGERFNRFDEMYKSEGSFADKKQRVPTFNQLTAPYHEPFCLDIYISKASVRACIIHRGTSKVVAVAHSISKDMKFDLGSTRNAAACDAVGKVLAQRALADDIHNVVYTPRKDEKIEGKLQTVLQSLINNGLWVKVKLKQKKVRKAGFQSADYKRG